MVEDKKRTYVKIIKKERDGVTCYFPGVGKNKATWDEFNQIYEIDPNDKFKAYVKPEWVEKHDKANECYEQALVHFMMNNGESGKIPEKAIVNNLVVMDQVKKAAEIMDISEGQSMKIFSELLHRTLGGFVHAGIGIGGKAQNLLSEKQQKRNAYNNAKFDAEKAEKQLEKQNRETYSYRPFANLKLNNEE